MSALKKFRAEKSATHVRDGIAAVRMVAPESGPHPLPNTFTPLEQQVVDLRMTVPTNMILVIMCGYKMKCFGRDARVVARRLGFQCMFPSNTPFEYCSFPVQRTILHCSRLVSMGYHVGIVDQVESAAARAAEGTSASKVFERKLTRALSKGSAPDFTSLTIGSSGSGGGGAADDDDDDGEGGGDGAGEAAGNASADASSSRAADDENNFVLFIHEAEAKTELTFVSIGSRVLTHKTVAVRDGGSSSSSSGSQEAASPFSKYQEEVVSALQAGLLCYAPVEVVVKSTLSSSAASPSSSSAPAEPARLSPLLSSVMNAMCQYHMGPSSDDDSAASSGGGSGGMLASKGSTLVTIMDEAMEKAYATFIKERGLGLSAAAVADDVDNNNNTDPNAGEGDGVPVATRPMMDAYFAFFQAADALRAAVTAPYLFRKEGTMLIPPTSLQALDVFPSARTAATNDSLFAFVNRSMTSYGARRLRGWLASPMCQMEQIRERQAAVREIANETLSKKLLRAFLKEGQGADIETTMTRLCSGRCSYAEYRTFLDKIGELRTRAEALVMAYTTALEELGGDGADASKVIEHALSDLISDSVAAALKEESLFTKYSRDLSLEEVLMKGLHPLPPALQRERDAIRAAEASLEEQLEEARSILGMPSLQYKTVALVTNLIEVPAAAEKKVPKEWSVVSRVKAATRYRTDEIVHQCAVRTAAGERLAVAAKDHFAAHQRERYGRAAAGPSAKVIAAAIACADNGADDNARGAAHHEGDNVTAKDDGAVDLYTSFNNFISAVATLDALQSFAVLASTPGFCLPTLVPQTTKGVLAGADGDADASSSSSLILRGLAHPMVRARHPSYVACDVTFDGPTRAWLLTGPNMGGKSALMRSVALSAILGQCGAHVPATEAVLPIFTSIWCRMGAQDDLLEGSSTFMLEMRETRDIVTAPDLSTSLVLMDELGRGTSSYDGVAVADATLSHVLKARCICLFVTHYHLLTDWHRHDATLALKYMNFAELDAEAGGSASDNSTGNSRRRIVFLYQPVDGVTPSSFGINVAAMAGLPEEVLAIADSRSRLAERRHSATRALHVARTLLKQQ